MKSSAICPRGCGAAPPSSGFGRIPQNMKRWLNIPLLACALGASEDLRAADWWFVPADKNQDRSAVIYVEKSSMLRVRGTGKVAAQVWIIHRSDQAADFGNYRSGKLRVILDCEAKEFGSNSGTYYSAFGGIAHQYRTTEAKMAAVQANSLQEVMAKFMCSDGKSPSRSLPVYDPNRDSEQRFLQYDRDRPSKWDPGLTNSQHSAP